jgi:hypothetical protein
MQRYRESLPPPSKLWWGRGIKQHIRLRKGGHKTNGVIRLAAHAGGKSL